jgi:hypothetical protein
MKPNTNKGIPLVKNAICKSPAKTAKWIKAFVVCALYAAPSPGQTKDNTVAMNAEGLLIELLEEALLRESRKS